MKSAISQTVSKWVEEESQHRTLALKVIRQNDPWQRMTEEEIEDRREYVRCYLLKDFELLLMIPIQPRENDFWFSSHQEFIESPFNTHDFQRNRKPFDKYGYRIKKVLEQIKDLAILHSCISQAEGRKNIQTRFENLVNQEFRNTLLEVVERHRKTFDEGRRAELRRKIAKLSRHILECKAIWQRWSPWEGSPAYHGSQDGNRNSQTSSLGQEEVFRD